MIIVLKPNSTPEQIAEVKQHIIDLGYDPRVITGVERTVIGAVGDELSHRSLEALRGMGAIENVVPIQKRYKLASREYHPENTLVKIGRSRLGGKYFQMIAGPCAVESREQVFQAASDLVKAGVRMFRGGVFKPRTSPYDFQGMGDAGLELLAAVKADFGLDIVTEVVGVAQVERVAKVVDMIQIGARNCQNYNLLEVVAGAGKPVLLKRGMAVTVEEWISAAEYLLVHGCEDVVLCERGIRTFETATRNTLDLSAVAVAKSETYLPVIVDPSHAAGVRSLVAPLAKAAIAVGADGLLVEAHPHPLEALSDASQQLPSDTFGQLMADLRGYVELAGKIMP